MNKMTWGDLLKVIQENVTDLDSCVMIHNAETGDEYIADFAGLTDDRKNERFVITFNHECWHDE